MARFDLVSWCYDYVPIPTHAEAVAAALRDRRGPVVDVGGGTGRFTTRFTPRGEAGVVVDVSGGMLQRARRAGRPLHLLQASAAAIPLRDGTVGAVVATEAFHHFADVQDAVLAEAARVLRPDGVLVVEELDPTTVGGGLTRAMEVVMRYGSAFHAPAAFEDLARRHFRDVTTRSTGHATYLLEATGPRR